MEVAYQLASVPLLRCFANNSSQFVETSIKYVLKFSHHIWNQRYEPQQIFSNVVVAFREGRKV